MMYPIGFSNVALIPIRASASHRAEMVTQLLFGEAYYILNYESDWAKIRTLFDDYEGYIDAKQVVLMHQSDYKKYDENLYVVDKQVVVHDKMRGFSFTVPQGATLPICEDGHTIRLGKEHFELPIVSTVSYFSDKESKTSYLIDKVYDKAIKEIALSFLNVPYLWGGRSILGIDCSGFVQMVYKILLSKKALPRDASKQVLCGTNVNFADIRCGDLAFFHNENGNIVHVGLMLDNETIIHSSAKVRIDKLDKCGIFCKEREEYSHRLNCIKRI